MKKPFIITISIILLIYVFAVFYFVKYVDFFEIIDYILTQEMIDDIGQEFTSYIQPGCKFQINHDETGYKLNYVEGENLIILFDDITSHSTDISSEVHNFYIVSDHGYALITPEYKAIICLTDNEFQRYSNEDITYLNEFSEFDEDAQKQFSKRRNLKQDITYFLSCMKNK